MHATRSNSFTRISLEVYRLTEPWASSQQTQKLISRGNSERKHGLSTQTVPVSANVGSSKNLKDLNSMGAANFDNAPPAFSSTVSLEKRCPRRPPTAPHGRRGAQGPSNEIMGSG